MISRKDFLKKSSLTALAGLSLPFLSKANRIMEKMPAQEAESTTGPLVIATWKNLPATEAAMKTLLSGGSSLDAVEAGVRIPESDADDTSVGYGGLPDRDGIVTLDACVMDHLGNAGAVTYLQNIMHPVSVARKVMEKTPHVTLSGAGAFKFAIAQGFKKENLLTDKAKEAWKKWKKENNHPPAVNKNNHDTIGLLAMDENHDISGACSTSGWAFKMHGRVGDSPVLGAGMFVDNEVGGACATGQGELVLKTLGSFLIVELMRNGRSPQEAVEEAIARIVKKYSFPDMQVGYVAINKKGEHGAFAIRNGFQYSLNRKSGNQVLDSAFHSK